MKRQRGFTLIEMMVVVAIVGILAAFLISVASRPVSANASNVSEQIVTTMGFARLRAASTRKTHLVKIEPTRISIWVATNTGLATPTAYSTVPIQTYDLPRGVTIYDARPTTAVGTPVEDTGLNYEINFRPDGQTWTNGATPRSGSTLYITDGSAPRNTRVLVYAVTGGAYARSPW